MNHEEQLILYVANQLDEKEKKDFEKHLFDCDACQIDLKLWNIVADEIIASDSLLVAPAHVADSTLEKIRQPKPALRALRTAIQLLRAQFLIIQNELWLGSAILLLIFLSMALLVNRVDVIYVFLPMIAAGTVSFIYGHEYDTALELTLATPTSAWKILLARLTLVSSYNFLLAIGTALILLVLTTPALIFELLLGWLAPMLFLSALALLLSLWLGNGNALFISYGLWISQYISIKSLHVWLKLPTAWLETYRQFWQSPALLLLVSFIFFLFALWSVNQPRVIWRRSTL